MIKLGHYFAGETVEYANVFHDDDNTPADPSSPSGRVIKPDDTVADLTGIAKIDSKDGWYGSGLLTTDYPDGTYRIYLTGTVSEHVISCEFEFEIISARRLDDASTRKYGGVFHDDDNTPADPSSPFAFIKNPDDSVDALTNPAKIDSKTGWYGGSIDASSFEDGTYIVYFGGTVSGHVVAAVYIFTVWNYTGAAAPAAPDIILNQIVNATSIKVELQRVTGEYMKVGYRQFKHQAVDVFTLSAQQAGPSNGDLVTLENLPEDIELEILGWGYATNSNSEIARSEPSNRLLVTPSASGRTIKKILAAVKLILQTNLNTQIAQLNVEHDTDWDSIPDANYHIAEIPAKWLYPAITILSSGTSDIIQEGDRREYGYDMTILVSDRNRAETEENLEDRLKDYLRAIEDVIFENMTIGGLVYECKATQLGLDPFETQGPNQRDGGLLYEILVTNG